LHREGGGATSPLKKGNTPTVFRYCIALEYALYFRQSSGMEVRPIFENLAIGDQHSAFSQNQTATLCRTLGDIG
jgi:hypothetical protein